MEEIWKLWKEGYKSKGRDIPAIYISNMGNIKGRNLHFTKKDGYAEFFYKNKNFMLHRIVAELFIPNPENKPEVDHINTITKDNKVDNLRWATRKENCNNKISKIHYSNAAKIKSKENCRKILQYSIDGNFIKEWGSIQNILDELNFKTNSHIIECCKNKRNKAYNYVWKYAKEK